MRTTQCCGPHPAIASAAVYKQSIENKWQYDCKAYNDNTQLGSHIVVSNGCRADRQRPGRQGHINDREQDFLFARL